MPVTPGLITWARERAGFTRKAAAVTFKKIAAWEAGEAFPSYPQLEKLADTFKVPIAVFFFPEPPDLPSIKETFRTLGSEQFDQIPPRIRLLLRKALTFQMGLSELSGGRNLAERLITRDLTFQPNASIDTIANSVRAYLGVPIEQHLVGEISKQHWSTGGTYFSASGSTCSKINFDGMISLLSAFTTTIFPSFTLTTRRPKLDRYFRYSTS